VIQKPEHMTDKQLAARRRIAARTDPKVRLWSILLGLRAVTPKAQYNTALMNLYAHRLYRLDDLPPELRDIARRVGRGRREQAIVKRR